MAVEFLIALFLLTALLSGVAGYAIARRSAPGRSHLDALELELENAEQRAEKVQANVTGHFEQSALLFGQLARDYRAFLEHFSESAQALGISEVKARELLARADQPLLGQTDAVIEGGSAASDPARPTSEGGDTAPTAVREAEAAPGPDDAPIAARERSAAGAAQAAARPDDDAVEPEPPLVEDIVDTPTTRARVVDVEVDALGLPIEHADRQQRAGSSSGRE